MLAQLTAAYNPRLSDDRIMDNASEIAFLRASDLFENQPEDVLRAVVGQGEFLEFGPGAVIFRQGDQGDRLYLVKSGVLEVVAQPSDGSEPMPVAYLGPGEVLGELALLTGSPRTATLRSPEHAELFSLEKAVFHELMSTLPTLPRNMCLVLAKRLEATTLKIPRQTGKQLQGNLKFFDLATVIQTLIGSHQTGILTVTQEEGRQKYAEIVFMKGNICRAKVRHLTGDDAVFQLFQSPLEGEFAFTGRNIPEEEVQGSDITMPAISLLMESVRLQDELPVLQTRLNDPNRIFKQKAAQLQWDDPDTVELAASVWSRLKKGTSLAELQKDVPRCTYWIYKSIDTMLASGQIE